MQTDLSVPVYLGLEKLYDLKSSDTLSIKVNYCSIHSIHMTHYDPHYWEMVGYARLDEDFQYGGLINADCGIE